MLAWAKNSIQSGLSTVAGTAEPIYGPDAIQPVSVQEDQNPTYEIAPEDLEWRAMEATSAETQTFYIQADLGHYLMVQAIYSNVMNLHLTTQFNVKIFYPDGTILWSPKVLINHEFDEKKRCFYADDFSIELSEGNDSYTIKSAVDPEAMVDIKISRVGPAVKVGKDASTKYGTDHKNPWGSIRHVFWPRAKAEGVVIAKEQKLLVDGKAMFVMALQGMKPHHAAASWRFLNFQAERYSAIMMEFTTPPSYAETTVNVSSIVTDNSLVVAGTKAMVEYPTSECDEITQWNEPKSVKAVWRGSNSDGKEVEATLEALFEKRLDCVDFMAEVPQIIKSVIAGAVGTRPYIYQYSQPAKLKLKAGEQVEEIDGTLFAESTFIS